MSEQSNNDYNEYSNSIKKLDSMKSMSYIGTDRDELIKHRLIYSMNMCKKLNMSEATFKNLNIIHITGTKGKGSTCAFVESILRNSGYKTGLISSPHLIEIKERVKINGQPLSYDKFRKYFDHCYELIVQNKTPADEFEKVYYYQFLTVLAFYIFSQENIDVAIVEVGIGGEYDFTNIIPNPVVCGITSLALDHCDKLGNTLEEIAWHKSGIFKPLSVAFTLENQSALKVIKERAEEKNIPLCLVPHVEQYVDENGKEVELGLNGEVQYINSSLALQIAKYWIDYKNNENLDKSKWIEAHTDRMLESNNLPLLKPVFINEPFANGLSKCFWPGRNQIIESENKKVTYYLDGAHTVESIEQFVKWFQLVQLKKPKKLVRNVLLFNYTGDRDSSHFLESLSNIEFSKVAFAKLVPYPELFINAKMELAPKLRKRKNEALKYKDMAETFLKLFQERHKQDENDLENNTVRNTPKVKKFNNIFDSLLWLTNKRDASLTNQIEYELNRISLSESDFGDNPDNLLSNRTRTESSSSSSLGGSRIHTNVLVTGSLYLVGLTLEVLDFKI